MSTKVAEGVQHGRVLDVEDFIRELDVGLTQPGRDRLDHPFIHAVERGEATLNQVAGWLHQFALWADAANKYFGHLYTKAPDDDLRWMLLENLLEEERGETSGTAGHVELINRTLGSLGWSHEDIARDTLKYQSWALLHWWETLFVNYSFLQCAASISFAAERLNPIVFGRVATALRKNYDIDDEALISLDVHASEVEEEHGELGPLAVRRYATTAWTQEAVRFAVFHSAEMYCKAYDVWLEY